MRVLSICVWTILLVCQVETVFGQRKDLTSEAFYEKYAQVLGKSRDLPRRRTQRAEYSDADGTRIETEVEEIDTDGNFRNLKTVKMGRKTTVREMIVIDNQHYCRIGRGRWKRASDACGEGYRVVTGEGESTESFTIESAELDSKVVYLLRAYTVIKKTDAKETVNHRFIENKVCVANDDLIIKREYTTGNLPNKVDTKLVESYEYNPRGLKIVKPIK